MGKPYTTFQKEIAFDAYYAMGEQRDLSTLALHLVNAENFKERSPTEDTLKAWSRGENWQERLKQRDIENSLPVLKKTDKEVVKTKATYRTYIAKQLDDTGKIEQRVTKLIADATKLIEEGKLKAESVKDVNDLMASHVKLKSLEKELIKLDLVMIGEADSRQDHTISLLDVIQERAKRQDDE